MFGRHKNFFLALSVLIGTIVGAGIFGIPYVVSKSGLLPGFFYLALLGVAVVFIHLFLGEIILRTKEEHRLIGYSEKYLGSIGKSLIAVAVIVGVTGALLAYIILAGDFLSILFSGLGPTSFHFSLLFWFVLSFFVFRGLKLIAPTELFTNVFFFLIIFLVFFLCYPKIDSSNFVLVNVPDIFLPYGVILFSLVGWSAIPELLDILKKPEEKKHLKKIVITAAIIIVLFYVLFTLSVIGVSGQSTTPDVLSGLFPFLGRNIIVLGALAALLTLADSFLVLALYLKNTFLYDFNIKKNLAFLVAVTLPLILFLIGFRSFITTISFVGVIIGVIEGVVIILMFKKAKTLGDRIPEFSLKVPSLLLYLLIAILFLGALSQLV